MRRTIVIPAVWLLSVVIWYHITVANGRDKEPGIGDRAIKVHYDLSKRDYLVVEPIFLGIKAENYGTKIECYQISELWKLELKDETSNLVKFRGNMYSEARLEPAEGKSENRPCRSGSSQLLPGEISGGSSRNLLDYYGEGQGGYDFYLKAGTYTITAHDLTSDTITFRIVWPTSSVDSAAATRLISIADDRYRVAGNYEQMYQVYSDFVRSFPNSIYTQVALINLLYIFPGDPQSYTETEKQYYARYMITKFPESGFAFRALENFKVDMVPVAQKSAVAAGLRKLKATLSPGSLQQRADELLEKLSK